MRNDSPPPPIHREDLDHILIQTERLWEDLRGQNIFITGGTGFFGMWLLESFAHANEHLGLGSRAVVLTRSPDWVAIKAPHLVRRRDVEFMAGDIRDFLFPSGSFPFLIHAAAPSNGSLEPEEMLDTIINGTRRVLDFAASCGARKFLFTSSGAIYGRQPSELSHLPDDFPGAPNSLDSSLAYGSGKRVAELMCCITAQKNGFEAKIARCFSFVGPHLQLDSFFAIGNFIRDVLNGRPISINGDGTPCRSYLYAADLMIWLWTILFRGRSARSYNVGSAHDISISQLATAVDEALGNQSNVLVAKIPATNAPASRYVPCVRRAKEELGLRESFDLATAIRRTADWYQEEGT